MAWDVMSIGFSDGLFWAASWPHYTPYLITIINIYEDLTSGHELLILSLES